MKCLPVQKSELTPRTQAGFTLLEILVASMLAAVILVALWSLSDIYLKLFAAGAKKIEETQIVRGVTRQFAKDISQVIQRTQDRPPAPFAGTLFSEGRQVIFESQGISPTFGATSQTAVVQPQTQSDRLVHEFGIFGTKQALRLIVLQTDPRTVRDATDLAEVLQQPGQPRPPMASELRTIEYTFASSPGGHLNKRQHPPGLLRREWAWETWSGRWQASHSTGDSMAALQTLPEQQAEWTNEDAIAFEVERDLFYLPQVTDLEFRYYDGQRWTTEWDSWERHRLPALVEILFQVDTRRDQRPSHDLELTSDESEVPLSLGVDDGGRRSTTMLLNSRLAYRQLVRLPVTDGNAGSEVIRPNLPQTQTPQSHVADVMPQARERQP